MVEPMWDGILQGGPFLEIAFLLDTGAESRVRSLERVLGTLKSLSFPITFIHAGQNPNIMQQFQEGHPYDPEDPGSLIGHEARFPLIMGFPEERKATLFVAEVASRTIQYDFWFYGSEFDAPEWDQRGISPGEKPKFLTLLEELFRVYKFPLGVIGIEADCLSLFPDEQMWPSEAFQIAQFDPNKMPDTTEVWVVLWQGKYLKNSIF